MNWQKCLILFSVNTPCIIGTRSKFVTNDEFDIQISFGFLLCSVGFFLSACYELKSSFEDQIILLEVLKMESLKNLMSNSMEHITSIAVDFSFCCMEFDRSNSFLSLYCVSADRKKCFHNSFKLN